MRRPGTRLKAPTYLNQPGRLYPIDFNSSQPYDIEFTDGWMRFFSGHRLVFTTDGPQEVVSISTATPAVMVLNAAVDWETDDEIYFTITTPATGSLPLRQRSFLVTKSDTVTFSLKDGLTGDAIDGSTLDIDGGSTITASRVLRLASPYVDGSWAIHRIVQNQDLAIILNPAYAPRMLTIAAGTIEGTAEAELKTVAFLDGPYLDPIPNSQISVSGGSPSSFTTWDSGTAYQMGTIVSYSGTLYQYGPQIDLSAIPPDILATKLSPIGVAPSTAGSGWAPITTSAALSVLVGTITLVVSFAAWVSTTTYNIGDYVSVAGVPYQSIANGNLNQDPTSATAFWSPVTSGTEVTGPNVPAVGFQTTDVGRLMRLYATPPEWIPNHAYILGDVVTYKNVTYKNVGGNATASINSPPDGGALVNNSGIATQSNATAGVIWQVTTGYQIWTWGVIMSVVSAVSVTMAIQGTALPVYSTSTSSSAPTIAAITPWRLGVYSDTTGFPACGSFYEGRFWFGGTVLNRFDTTQSAGFNVNGTINMAPTLTDGTVTDAAGISYTLEAKDANEIVWFEPDHQGILAGTAAGEWMIQASTLSDPITPTSIQAKRVTKYGCANIEPKRAGIGLVFIQKFRRRLMEFLADVYAGRYVAPHLNEAAKHLAVDSLAEIGYQEEVAPILWVRTGGPAATGVTVVTSTVSGCTFDEAHTNSLATLSEDLLSVDNTPRWVGTGVAIDLDAQKIWFWTPWDGRWNDGDLSAQNPATGAGGLAFFFIAPGTTLYPGIGANARSGFDAYHTINGGDSDWQIPGRTAPAGFSPWGAMTWDPLKTSAINLTLLNGNKTVKGIGVSITATFATVGHSTGKYYFEVFHNNTASLTLPGYGPGDCVIGLGIATADLDNPSWPGEVGGQGVGAQSSNGKGWRLTDPTFIFYNYNTSGSYVSYRNALSTLGHSSGKYYFEMTNAGPLSGVVEIGLSNYNNALGRRALTGVGLGIISTDSVGLTNTGALMYAGSQMQPGPMSYTAGQTIGVAVDLDNNKLWFYTPSNGFWNGQAISLQNPASNIGGLDIHTSVKPLFAAASVSSYTLSPPQHKISANFGQAAFTYTMPDGFVPWAVNVTTETEVTGYTIPPGDLIGATYRRVTATATETPAFVAWHKHDLGHGRRLQSIAVGPDGDGELDGLGMLTTDGNANYFVEGMTNIFDEGENINNAWFVDGGLVPDSAYEDTVSAVVGIRFTGLWYLIARSVAVVAFGLDLGDYVVEADGTIFVPYGSGTAPDSFDYTAPGAGAYLFTAAYIASNLVTEAPLNGGISYGDGYIPCVVGHTFTSQGQTLRPIAPEQAGARTGPAFGALRRSHYIKTLLHNTIGIQFGTDFGATLQLAKLSDDAGNQPAPSQAYSGLWRETLNDDYTFDSMLSWQIVRPYPASVVSIGASIETQET